ncbi:MAG: hypothetical protein H6730_01505 [Deltaproteobacteria bacterium]|nr:hypothetical protein [Deltaproteobacteria bacterium]
MRPIAALPLALFASAATAGPPVQSNLQAVALLKAARTEASAKAAVKSVTEACRGKLRHSLRDHPPLLSSAQTMAQAEDAGVRRAALDLDRCFTPAKFVTVVAPRLADPEPQVVAYAAEVAARLADPVVVAPLLEALGKRKAACLAPGLEKPEVEVCVWLTYAPGAALETADAATRAAAADAAVAMFAAPYAKVREVAVETVASARLARHGAAVEALIAKEKAKGFPEANDPALLERFSARRKALARGE